MTYPPQPGPGHKGYGDPPQQGYGAPQPGHGVLPHPGYAAPQQNYAPQPNFGAPQQPGYSAPQQPGYGAPQQWPGQPLPPNKPAWQQPPVLVLGAVILVLVLVLGVILATRGGDSEESAQVIASSSTAAEASSPQSTTSSSAAKPTTTTKTQAAPVPAAVQPIIDALPAPLRQEAVKNQVRQRAGDSGLGYDVAAGLTIKGQDPLLKGLGRYPDNDYFPTAYITTNPDRLLRIWNSQHPDWLSDEGSRMVRIDPGNQNSKGTATLEVYLPQSKLYFSVSGFENADAAKQFVQRAGF
ncbi:hypothetical protein JK358_00010 [Nocardia sp. 2]|uniref:Serine/threonine protein kinase n=1 Tax=Nocardia acididurans TaxID=2802282 RepID=A0ABS1LXM4_9NOCA|nr:hypothetical protein [Nocardia acididurans]MBL1072771.1 hypothetical protein [Nocardia acididurans]